LQRHATIHFLAHAQGVVKMAWCGDVRLKQWAVTEFHVVEKESVTNIYRRLKICMETTLLIKALLVVALRKLRALRKAKRSSVMCHSLAGQHQQSL
jgi:hypothetical protein